MFAVLPDEVSFSKDRRGPFYCEVQLLLTFGCTAKVNPRQVSGLVSWQGLVPFGMLFLFGFGWISRYFQPNQVDSEAAKNEVPMMRDEPLSWLPASAEKVGGARLRESL